MCLGLIDLALPYYCDGGVFEHFLLLSWAGRPLPKCIDQLDKTVAVDAVTKAYTEIHRLGGCQRDAEVRNVLYDGNIVVVDFERAEVRSRQPLRPGQPERPRPEEEEGTAAETRQRSFCGRAAIGSGGRLAMFRATLRSRRWRHLGVVARVPGFPEQLTPAEPTPLPGNPGILGGLDDMQQDLGWKSIC